nr:hypothetical protein [Halalkalicoccus paucihalophilus]
MTDDSLPAEHLSPLATLVDEVLAGVGYEVAAATDAIDDVVPGYGGLFELGQQALARYNIVTVAIKELEKLAERTQEMTSLLIGEHGYGIFVCSLNGDTGGRTFSRIGQRVPLHATGSGKQFSHISRRSRFILLLIDMV